MRRQPYVFSGRYEPFPRQDHARYSSGDVFHSERLLRGLWHQFALYHPFRLPDYTRGRKHAGQAIRYRRRCCAGFGAVGSVPAAGHRLKGAMAFRHRMFSSRQPAAHRFQYVGVC